VEHKARADVITERMSDHSLLSEMVWRLCTREQLPTYVEHRRLEDGPLAKYGVCSRDRCAAIPEVARAVEETT
jgi:hypothetical protein